MARTTAVNYTASGEDFNYTDAATDAYQRAELQKLGKAVDNHDHSATRGLAVARLGAGAATDAAIGNRTAVPANAPTGNGPGTLQNFVDWFANRVKAITGTTNWWDAPAATIATLWAKFNNTTGHTHNGASDNGPLLTDAAIAAANKDGAAGTASMRTLGAGATQAAAGNHTHSALGNGIASASALVSITDATNVDMDSMSVTITTIGGPVVVLANLSLNTSGSAGSEIGLAVKVDAAADVEKGVGNPWASGKYDHTTVSHLFTGLSAGSHTFKVRWRLISGVNARVEHRSLVAFEL